jgi:hypothetical protein
MVAPLAGVGAATGVRTDKLTMRVSALMMRAEVAMAVLMRDNSPISREMYSSLAGHPELLSKLRNAFGFIAHFPVPHGDRVIVTELWESQTDSERFIREVVVPMREQAGIQHTPQIDYQELPNLILRRS